MARVREAGAGLSIDDFGTGASTLSEFRSLPFDTVKIDRSFLARHAGSDIDADGEVVLSWIVAMAHDLKRRVVAEGVESEADAQFLAKIGCDFGQGYYFSPPLNAAAALSLHRPALRCHGPDAYPEIFNPNGDCDMTSKSATKFPLLPSCR